MRASRDAFDGFGGGIAPARSRSGKTAESACTRLLAATLTLATLAAMHRVGGRGSASTSSGHQFVAHVLARWSSLVLIRRYPYVRPASDVERPSAGRPFVAGVTVEHLIASTLIMLLILEVAMGWQALLPLIVALVVTAGAGWYFHRRIGGITGDALGAANQIVEVFVYLTLAARVT